MSFEDVYKKETKKFEGGYVNDPMDRGLETVRGIYRVSFPNWPGWAIVDLAKTIVGTSQGLLTLIWLIEKILIKWLQTFIKNNSGTRPMPKVTNEKIYHNHTFFLFNIHIGSSKGSNFLYSFVL
jgi:hypothetical protein